MSRRLFGSPGLVVRLPGSGLPRLSAAAARQQNAPAKILRINGGDYFPESTFDPQLSDNGQGYYLFDFEGLTRIDEQLQVVPGAAESWEFSPDGKTLSFHLRDGLFYSDGVPVVATDFVYAAERLCSPELNSFSRNLLVDVVGCEELYDSGSDAAAAEAARASFGVRALDERTLEYHFKRPAPYFIVQACNWSAIPLRKELVEQGGPKWW